MKLVIHCLLLGTIIGALTLPNLMAAPANESIPAAAVSAQPGSVEAIERPADQTEETLGLWEIMQKGGLLMWVLLAGSVVALAVFVERTVYFRRRQINVAEFLTGILSLVRRHRYLEALERCDE